MLRTITAQTVGALQASPFAEMDGRMKHALDELERAAWGDEEDDGESGFVTNLAREDD